MSSFLSSLKDLPNRYYVRPLPFSCHVNRNWSFRDHLFRSIPTEKIFDLLRKSIRSGLLIGHYPTESESDMLKVIIKWLEVSLRECNRQLETPQTNNPICSRDLVLRDRATCTQGYCNLKRPGLISVKSYRATC